MDQSYLNWKVPLAAAALAPLPFASCGWDGDGVGWDHLTWDQFGQFGVTYLFR